MQDEPIPVVRRVDFGTAKLMPDVDRARAWLLTVDDAPQSYVDLDDPRHLEFEYVRRIAYVVESYFDAPVDVVRPDVVRPDAVQSDVVRPDAVQPDVVRPDARHLDAVHLGGGALTLPRRLVHTLPGTRHDVVEADAGLVALVAEHLPVAEPGVRVHTADARAWLADRPAASADLVIGDVFGVSRVPAHVTSVEFAAEVARVLRPDGLYAANLADAAPFAFLGSQLATVREAFGGEVEICVLAEPGVVRGRRFGNAVLAVSRRPLPLSALTRLCAADPFPARVLDGDEAARAFPGAPVRDATATGSPRPPDGAFSVG